MNTSSNLDLKSSFKSRNYYSIRRELIKPVFWLVFCLNYFYINRLLIIATGDRFRLGVVVLGLSVLIILANLWVIKNTVLAFITFIFIIVSLISGFINHISLLQLIAFIRIPIIVYLVYHIVNAYIINKKRAQQVLRILFGIAIVQLPLIILQRAAYPYVPDWFRFNSTIVDFGMGTFPGDTAMASALIGLVILLLFGKIGPTSIYKRWLLAGWLTITILLSNSQIQQITIILIWVAYILSHLSTRTILFGGAATIMVGGMVLAFTIFRNPPDAPAQSAIAKIAQINVIFQNQMDYEAFYSGRHARAEALHYYTHQPIIWIGSGPGSVYDTSTGQRTVGGWGHVFTFYAEVGIIGLLLSYMIFFVIAFPIKIIPGNLLIRFSAVRVLIFMSVILVSIVKYPLGDSSIIFTYCLLLAVYEILANTRKKIALPLRIYQTNNI